MSVKEASDVGGSTAARNRAKPMFAGLSGETSPGDADWTYVDRLKELTRMKLVLKGIETAEDATLAVEHGADGVVVSNRGGRATETGRGTIDVLPEVADAVRGAGFRSSSMADSVAAAISTRPQPHEGNLLKNSASVVINGADPQNVSAVAARFGRGST